MQVQTSAFTPFSCWNPLALSYPLLSLITHMSMHEHVQLDFLQNWAPTVQYDYSASTRALAPTRFCGMQPAQFALSFSNMVPALTWPTAALGLLNPGFNCLHSPVEQLFCYSIQCRRHRSQDTVSQIAHDQQHANAEVSKQAALRRFATIQTLPHLPVWGASSPHSLSSSSSQQLSRHTHTAPGVPCTACSWHAACFAAGAEGHSHLERLGYTNVHCGVQG